MNLSTHAVILSGSRGAGQVVMALVIASVAREVGPARLGVVATSLAIAAVAAGVIDFGANSLWVRELSSGKLPLMEFRRRSGGKLAVGLTLSVTITVVCVLSNGSLRGYWGTGLLLASYVIVQTLQVALIANRMNIHLAMITLLDRAVLWCTYAVLHDGLFVAPETAFYVSCLFAAGIDGLACLLVVPPGHRPAHRGLSPRTAWSGSRHYGFSSLLTALQSLETVIAAVVGGPAVAGAYGAVNKWTVPIALATNSFTTLLAPVAAKARDAAEVWRTIRGSLWLPGTSVAVAVMMAAASHEIVVGLMGVEFVDSIPVLQLLCIAAALSAMSQTLLVLLQARRRERFVARSLGVVVTLHLAIVGPLVYWQGAVGAAIAAVVAQSVLLVVFVSGASAVIWRLTARGATGRALPCGPGEVGPH